MLYIFFFLPLKNNYLYFNIILYPRLFCNIISICNNNNNNKYVIKMSYLYYMYFVDYVNTL